MKFSDKIKKLRQDNNLTQDELAEKIFVSRTAISKWETDNGYPSIESLKMITKVFHITFDELISDQDLENKKILEEKQSRIFYWFSFCSFMLTIIFTIIAEVTKIKYFLIGAFFGVFVYVVCSYFVTPKYKRIEKGKDKFTYFLPKIIVVIILILIVISTLFL